jgi:hypothetical protein
MKKRVSGVVILQLMILAAAALFGWRIHQRLEASENKLKDLSENLQRFQQEAAGARAERANRETAAEQHHQVLDLLKHAADPGKVFAPLTNPASPKPEIPPGWVPFEFNGLTYYYTPLSASPQVSVNEPR